MGDDSATDASTCPVDHKARAAWLETAQRQKDAQQQQQRPIPSAPTNVPSSNTCNSSTMAQSAPSKQQALPSALQLTPKFSSTRLSKDREVSSIPRAISESSSSTSAPANSERDTAADAKTGNWIYPSEEMFFNAMRRKHHNPVASDMRTIIPIHNAVNERAWKEIKVWEANQGGQQCGGPRLVSFAGDSSKLTPRARMNVLLGYSRPFDRHDWVVDRCGTKVEYVIDFYKGKENGKGVEGMSFYLDVRPKLNTWEGCKMRAMKFVGL